MMWSPLAAAKCSGVSPFLVLAWGLPPLSSSCFITFMCVRVCMYVYIHTFTYVCMDSHG